LNFHVNNKDFAEFARLISRDADFEKTPCHLKVRVHYSRDVCVAGTNWEYPVNVNPSTDCKSQNKGDEKNAIVAYFTEEGHRLSKSLTMAEENLPNIASRNPGIDLILATGPLDDWTKERRDIFLNMTVRLNQSLKGKLIHATPETIAKTDLTKSFFELLHQSNNCCSWSEYQKLGAWNMVQYDSVLVIDFDVKFYRHPDKITKSAIPDLLRCSHQYDFLSTLDPSTALNGGFYMLKPDHQTYLAMKQLLAMEGLYDPYSGWNNSGPLFSPLISDYNRARLGKKTQAFAMETNQGFLFYFHYIYLSQNQNRERLSAASHLKLNLNVAQLDVCKFNFRNTLEYREALSLACAKSIAEALHNDKNQVEILVRHGHFTSPPYVDFKKLWFPSR